MHAFLIETTNPTEDELKKVHFDQKIHFEIKKISDVRDLKKFLRFPPQCTVLCVINGMEEASIEAQNSLLKTIEEPPHSSILFLICVSNRSALLPTILSRVQIIEKNNTNKQNNSVCLTTLSKSEQLTKISNVKDRAQAINFIEEILDSKNEDVSVKEMAIEALTKLKRNTNVTLTLLSFVTKI